MPVDYAALAAQARRDAGAGPAPAAAPVDYAALADQARTAPAAAPPDFAATNQKDAAGDATIWDRANTPLLPQIATAGHAIADFLARSNSLGDAKLNELIPGAGTLSAWIKGGAAGMVEGAGELAAGFTSPIGAVMTIAGLGPESALLTRAPALKGLLELPAVRTLQRAIQGTGSAGFAAHGAEQIATEPTLAGKARGLAEFAGGAAGATAALGGSAPRAAAPERPVQAFADRRGIRTDPATMSDNLAVKGLQALTDRSLGGSLVATPARAGQAADMARVGQELAAEAHPAMVTPEQGGLRQRAALEDRGAAHGRTADRAYDAIRAAEADPNNQMRMRGKPTPVDAIPDEARGQLRRIVHEMDAAPYTKYQLQETKHGGSFEHVAGTGGAGAAVFDDIVQRAGSHATRGTVQQHLEEYLGGGPETSIVKAALEVAGERRKAQGGYTVSRPEMGSNVMDVPTRLEGRETGELMGLPAHAGAAKPAIQAVVDAMERQLPFTQQQANPGLKALRNVLDGPDWAPLSVLDKDLGAMKELARAGDPLAKFAVTKLDAAVREAARNGGPAVVKALNEGRAATVANYRIEGVLKKLHLEPVKAVKALTAPEDSAIQQLRSVVREVPEQTPILARAYLEDLLASKSKVAEWGKLGAETKKLLFPTPGHAAELDHFFELTDRISKKNSVNSSGSAHQVSLGAQAMQLVYSPLTGIPLQVGAYAMAKLVHSPAALRAMSRGLSLPRSAPTALRTATQLSLVQAAHKAGVPLEFPRAADAAPDEPTQQMAAAGTP